MLCVLLVMTLSLLPADPAGVFVTEHSVMVEVPADDAGGSGTLINHRGEVLVLTSAHLVGKVTEKRAGWPLVAVTRKGKDVTRREAKVIYANGELDLAILRLKDPKGLDGVYVPKKVEPTPGDTIHFCGFGCYVPWNYQRGVVNSVEDAWLNVNGDSWFGHSGAGVFLERKHHCGCVLLELIGVVRGPVVGTERDIIKSPTRCVPLVKIHKALSELK